MITIKELCEESYAMAKEKGFHDKPLSVPEKLMLIVSELGEAMEADRKEKFGTAGEIQLSQKMEGTEFTAHFENWIKDSFADELADAVIRIGDLCGAMNIDLEAHVEQKIKYNATRPQKHNKKY